MVVNSSNVAEAATLLVAYYMPLLWNSTSRPSLWGEGRVGGVSPKQKNGWEHCSQPLSLELCLSLFSKADSLLRTYACACTALCAEIRVDRILFAF